MSVPVAVPPHRTEMLSAVADILADLGQEEVNHLLLGADLERTAYGWNFNSRPTRRLDVLRLLRPVADDVLNELYQELVVLPAGANRRDDDDSRVVEQVAAPEADASRLMEATPNNSAIRPDGPIFLVHGHDHRVLHYAARVVQQCTGRDVLILHEQPNGGRTLLEKFEEEAAGAAYAVVLLTGDDEGGLVGAGTHTPRARQNVVFELGFFFGKLGRKRVSVLLDKGVEEPSDLNGLVYIPLADASWRYDLLKDVQAAGIPVDYSRIP